MPRKLIVPYKSWMSIKDSIWAPYEPANALDKNGKLQKKLVPAFKGRKKTSNKISCAQK